MLISLFPVFAILFAFCADRLICCDYAFILWLFLIALSWIPIWIRDSSWYWCRLCTLYPEHWLLSTCPCITEYEFKFWSHLHFTVHWWGKDRSRVCILGAMKLGGVQELPSLSYEHQQGIVEKSGSVPVTVGTVLWVHRRNYGCSLPFHALEHKDWSMCPVHNSVPIPYFLRH